MNGNDIQAAPNNRLRRTPLRAQSLVSTVRTSGREECHVRKEELQ
jgi:hypothetical protein